MLLSAARYLPFRHKGKDIEVRRHKRKKQRAEMMPHDLSQDKKMTCMKLLSIYKKPFSKQMKERLPSPLQSQKHLQNQWQTHIL